MLLLPFLLIHKKTLAINEGAIGVTTKSHCRDEKGKSKWMDSDTM